jgi:hypothetical protein
MSLSMSDVVQVTIEVTPTPPAVKGFNTKLILGSNSLPLEERIRTYTTLVGGVDADFASNTEEYKEAAAHFGQDPAPDILLIGNRFVAPQHGKLRGSSAVSSTVSDYTGTTNGGFDISLNGTNQQIFGLDFSAAAAMADIATAIQTKLNAALASTTCTWDGTKFIITSPTTGIASIVGYAVAPTGGSSPTDVSTLLGFTVASGALAVAGIAAESMTDTINASLRFNQTWYGLGLTAAASTQDVKDSMAAAQASKFMFFETSADPNTAIGSATSDLAYFAKNLGYDHVAAFFDSANPGYLSDSAMARLFIVDFTQPNSITTLWGKQAPGFAPSDINETQKAALDGKNCNYYASVGGYNMFQPGKVANGRFIDEVIGLDWLQATLQNALFVALTDTTTGIPQTDPGVSVLVQAAENALAQAKTNGLLAPGVWTGSNIGNVKTGDLLTDGYYVFGAPVASQSPTDRAARKSPPITAIGIGAGAIQSVAIVFIFQR